MEHFDIVIITKNMLAVVIAEHLKRSGFHVAIFQEADVPLTRQETLSMSTVNRHTQSFFKKANLWNAIKKKSIEYSNLIIKEKDTLEYFHLKNTDLHQKYLGHIVKNQDINETIFSNRREDYKIFLSVVFSQINWGEKSAFIVLKNKQIFSAQLVLVIDDSNFSWLRKHTDVSFFHYQKYERKVFAQVETDKPHNFILRQVVSQEGIFTLFPLINPNSSMVSCKIFKEKNMFDIENSERFIPLIFDNIFGSCKVNKYHSEIQQKFLSKKSLVAHRLICINFTEDENQYFYLSQEINSFIVSIDYLISYLKNIRDQGKDFGQFLYLKNYHTASKHANTFNLLHATAFNLLSKTGFKHKKLRELFLKVLNTKFMSKKISAYLTGLDNLS